jgi:hypothetical protein
MKLVASVLFTLLLLFSSTARAEPSAPEDGHPVRLATGFGVMTSRDSDTSVTRYRFTMGPEFSYGDRLTLAPFLRMNSTTIELREKNDMPFDLSLTLPWQPTVGARADVRLFDAWKFRFTLRGEFETPISENRANINSFTAKGELAKVAIDADTIRNHVEVAHDWRAVSGSLVLSLDLGRVRPYVDVGYMVIDSSIVATFDQKAAGLLADAKVRPNRFYNDGTSSLFYIAGAQVDLGRGFGFRLGGTFIPAGDDKFFYAGEGAFVIPLDIPKF